MNDTLLLLCGALLLYVPGAAVLVGCRVRSPGALVGVAPVISIAVIQLAALLRWGLGTGLGKTVLGVVAAAVAWAVVAELRSGRDGSVVVGAARSVARRARSAPAAATVTVVLLGAAVFLGVTTWLHGFHGLATPPQEHDTVQHTLITAWIAHTGHAGPFEVMPTDLATGGGVAFYPAGAHGFAGVLAMVSGDPVSGLNATTALLVGLAGPVALFACGTTVELLRTRPVFSALAALLSVTLYRPYVELSHDAGILGFAMGLALLPSVVPALAALQRRGVGAAVALGLTALGLYSVHPSLAVIAVVTLVVAGVVGVLANPSLRGWIRERGRTLGVAVAVAVLLSLPWLIASTSAASSVASYPEAPPVSPLGDVVRDVVYFNYGGGVPQSLLFQAGFAVVFWIGFVGCLTSRRLWPLAAGWLVWAAVAVLYAAGHAGLPGLRQLGGLLYNSWTRLDAVVWLLAPLVGTLGIAALVTRLERVRWLQRPLLRQVLVPVTAAVLALGYLFSSGLGYRHVNETAVASRWGEPQFLRLSPIEPQAFDYLAAHRSEVGTVLNNGNDGSTFLYVYDAIPVVNTYPLGMVQERYGIYLMEHFNQIGSDPAVRCLVQRYHITHVLTSVSSPRLPTFAAPDHWVTTSWFDYPPGFADLEQVPEVQVAFHNPDVTVYRIDPTVLAGHDESACTADPEHPLPHGALD